MNRKAITLVECLVTLAIFVTLCGFVVAAASSGSPRQAKNGPPQSWNLYTAQHDGHWFVKDAGGGVCHHPDCPCHRHPTLGSTSGADGGLTTRGSR